MNTIWIVLPILTLLMFELGLNLKIEDFKLFKTRPKPVLAGLIGQIIILPLLAWLQSIMTPGLLSPEPSYISARYNNVS